MSQIDKIQFLKKVKFKDIEFIDNINVTLRLKAIDPNCTLKVEDWGINFKKS